MANQADFIVKSGLVVKATTTVPAKEQLVTTNIVRTPSRPTLDLNFTRSNTLDSRVSFSRASVATYTAADGTIKNVGTNQPRFNYDPTTGQCLGLLTEPSRANLITNTVGPITAFAGGNISTSTQEIPALHAPSTVNKHFRYTSLTGDNNVGYYFATINSNTVYTVSAYVWVPSVTTISSLGIAVDSASYTQVTADLTKRDRWQQIYTTATSTVTSSAFVLRPNGMVDGGYVYSTCWQIESLGSYPTSYIPCSGSSTTRAAEAISVSGQNFNNFYTQGQGTLYIESYLPGPRTSISGFMASLYRASTDYIGLQYVAALGFYTGTNYCVFNNNAIITDTVAGGASNYNRINKTAITYDSTGFVAVHDAGVYLYTGTNFTAIPLVTQLSIGGRAGSGTDFPGQGNIRRITYWPQRLSTSTLITLTGIY
jgi:hypothetical protein